MGNSRDPCPKDVLVASGTQAIFMAGAENHLQQVAECAVHQQACLDDPCQSTMNCVTRTCPFGEVRGAPNLARTFQTDGRSSTWRTLRALHAKSRAPGAGPGISSEQMKRPPTPEVEIVLFLPGNTHISAKRISMFPLFFFEHHRLRLARRWVCRPKVGRERDLRRQVQVLPQPQPQADRDVLVARGAPKPDRFEWEAARAFRTSKRQPRPPPKKKQKRRRNKKQKEEERTVASRVLCLQVVFWTPSKP